MSKIRVSATLAVVTLALLASPLVASAAASPSRIVQAGSARFEVLTPTLIRLEYSAGRQFQNLSTMTAINRDQPVPPYTVTTKLETLTIKTSAMSLSYVLNSGPFTPANVTVTLADGTIGHPSWSVCGEVPKACGLTGGLAGTVGQPENDSPCPLADGLCADSAIGGTPGTAIGGYQRELVSESVEGKDVFFPLHAGFLDTAGWYLLDDSTTALLKNLTTAVARPAQIGPYQDGYVFGYGDNYATGLADFASLTGAAPLLPRWTFGPWFSRYYAYSTADYEDNLIPQFRAHDTPLDGLVIDTNFKSPDSWNGWSWNPKLFPAPKKFLAWAARQGLHVVLNIHPSIDGSDPQFAATQKTADGGLTSPSGGCAFYRSSPKCYVFDWGNPAQAKAYFNLQTPFLNDGVSAFWLDWCCDASTVSTPGLTPDSWINNLYAQQLISRGQRGFVLSRIGSGIFDLNSYLGDLDAPASGAWADHRSAIAFTGDATSDWQTLAYEAQFTPAESAAIGEPYISNDIGGYSGNHLADDLYVRWVQLGTFSPIMRLHSNHGERLPWDYDTAAELPAEEFLRLREALVPYLYDTAWQATQTGLPMAREMAIGWPGESAALHATNQWMLGDSLLVAPITSGGTTASRSVWFPPGEWDNFFTGQQITGGRSQTATDGFSQAPVYIKAGGIVPMAPPMSYSSQRPLTPLTLRVGGGGSGSTTLYEDAGSGLGYQHGQYAKTHINYATDAFGDGELRVFPTQGSFPGQSRRRAYIVQIVGVAEPQGVDVNGHPEAGGPTGPLNLASTLGSTPGYDTWSYDATTQTLTVSVVSQSIAAPLSVTFQSSVAPLGASFSNQIR
jgi:hypothetical protein